MRADKRRPAVIVQTDKLRDGRITTFLVAPLNSRLHLDGLPGNVRLETRSLGPLNQANDRSGVARGGLTPPAPGTARTDQLLAISVGECSITCSPTQRARTSRGTSDSVAATLRSAPARWIV